MPNEKEIAKLFNLYNASVENAKSLISESKLLLDHKYHARSFTLSHLASEEMAKVLFVFDAFLLNCIGLPLGEREFLIGFRDHKTKIKYMKRFDYISTLNSDNEEFGESFESQAWYRLCTDESSVKNSNDLKNNSLYVGIFNEEMSVPEKIIPLTLAENYWFLNSRRLDAVSNFCAFTKSNIETILGKSELVTQAIDIFAKELGFDESTMVRVHTEMKRLQPKDVLRAFPSSFLEFYPRMIYVLDLIREVDLMLTSGKYSAKQHPIFLKIKAANAP